MAKYRVLKQFVDKYTKEKYLKDQEIEMTVKRAREVEDNLASYKVDFLERIDNKK